MSESTEIAGLTIEAHVAEHKLLGAVDPALRKLLLAQVTVRRLSPGEAITREGSVATRFYLLVEGGARVSRTRPDGGQEVLARLSPGALFGVLGVSDGLPRSTTVAATGPAICLVFPASLLDGAPRSPEARLALALREVVALAANHQLRAANRRLYSQGRRMYGETTLEPDIAPEGGWNQPE